MKKITYSELKKRLREHNEENKITSKGYNDCIKGVIVFTEDSFKEEYSLESRSYLVSSDNKAFIPGMGGYSIFGESLDGSDPCVRLEQYIDVECNDKNGWHVDYCYMVD